MGTFFIGMSVLQAWPGRGFWQGQLHGQSTPGTLTGMVQQMAQTPQPRLLSSWVASFAAFDAAHGWAVNLFLVIFLAVVGVAFISGRRGRRPCRRGRRDGGVHRRLGADRGLRIPRRGGTDPNSMVPIALVFTAGFLAMTKVPVTADAPTPIDIAGTSTVELP